MKKLNKKERKIITLIRELQLDLLIKSTRNAIKASENPSKTFDEIVKFCGWTVNTANRVIELNKAIDLIKQKYPPNYAKGGIIEHKDDALNYVKKPKP